MKIIAGLGNPDRQYLNTYHNLGFMAADMAAEKLGAKFLSEKCSALVAETRVSGEKVIIAKPLTYMNLSGKSVAELMSYFKVPLKNLLVVYDDFDLPAGAVRIRERGSAGTHNGMRSIISELGSEDFARIRIGFKPAGGCDVPLIKLVLSAVSEESRPVFDRALSIAAAAAAEFAAGETAENLMQKYNGHAADGKC